MGREWGPERPNTNNSDTTHVTIRTDSLIRIIKEAYEMGREDEQNGK